MPQYRGNWASNPRPPHAGCATERDRRMAYGNRCGISDPATSAGWYCTRPRGHRGDHVAAVVAFGILGNIRVRWGRDGSITDREDT
jgi:hypothetical protein